MQICGYISGRLCSSRSSNAVRKWFANKVSILEGTGDLEHIAQDLLSSLTFQVTTGVLCRQRNKLRR